jgi:hypothetical protein
MAAKALDLGIFSVGIVLMICTTAITIADWDQI